MRVRIAAMTILVLALTACTKSTSDSPAGPESLPADQLYEQALDNAEAQPSFHLTRTSPELGRLEVWSDGSRSLITADINGERGEIRRDGLDVVARGSLRFFGAVYAEEGGAALFAAAGPDHWVRHQTTDPRYALVKRLFDLRIMLHLFAPLARDDARDGTITLRDTVGQTLVVSLAGSPLPIRYVSGPTESDLSYGEPVAVTAPDPAEVVPAPPLRRP
jgi:hypothetical protein